MNAKYEQPGPLNLNVAGRNDLSSSWIREGALHVSGRNLEVRGLENRKLAGDSEDSNCEEDEAERRRGSNGHQEGVEPEQKYQIKVEFETSSSKSPRLTATESQVEEPDHKDGLSDSKVGGSEGDFAAGKSKNLLSIFLGFEVSRYLKNIPSGCLFKLTVCCKHATVCNFLREQKPFFRLNK